MKMDFTFIKTCDYNKLMNKKLIIIVAALLLLGVGGYLYMKKGTPAGIPGAQTGSQTTSVNSLKDLLAKGIAQSCTFSSDAESGTVYVSGGKTRGDFSSVTEGKTVLSHMIVDGNTSYLWTDGQNTGFKMSFDPNAAASATPGTAGTTGSTGSFDANANMNYKCSSWFADASKFALPAGVTFTSFSVPTMAPATTTGTSGNSSQCSYCDSLSGTQKTECLSALNCK